jgi:hypothetical protein
VVGRLSDSCERAVGDELAGSLALLAEVVVLQRQRLVSGSDDEFFRDEVVALRVAAVADDSGVNSRLGLLGFLARLAAAPVRSLLGDEVLDGGFGDLGDGGLQGGLVLDQAVEDSVQRVELEEEDGEELARFSVEVGFREGSNDRGEFLGIQGLLKALDGRLFGKKSSDDVLRGFDLLLGSFRDVLVHGVEVV